MSHRSTSTPTDTHVTAIDRQTAVVFTNRSGLRMFGVLHEPVRPSPGTLGVVLLSPGVKMRVGPQGLYRRLTELLVRIGLPVLRFDFYGLGDSEGDLQEDVLRDVYNHIEVGRFVDDTIDAMNWMQERCGTRRFVLSGLCGGAITGLLAGHRDQRVAGLLALGITPVLASRAADASAYMTQGQLAASRQKYIRRLLVPKAWFRLLTFRADYRLIWRFTAQLLRPKPRVEAAPAVPPENDNANPLFPPAFFSMLSTRRPLLLIFGGADRLRWEYEEKFVARHRQRLAELPPLTDVHVVEHANHVLSMSEWQQDMLAASEQWLRKHFSGDLMTPAEAAADGRQPLDWAMTGARG
jgi:pimeloyl-ACP methyl ester carboxylesterase